jgi:hypothetical protein
LPRKPVTPGNLIATQTLNSEIDSNWNEGGTLKSGQKQSAARPYGWLEGFKCMQWLNFGGIKPLEPKLI